MNAVTWTKVSNLSIPTTKASILYLLNPDAKKKWNYTFDAFVRVSVRLYICYASATKILSRLKPQFAVSHKIRLWNSVIRLQRIRRCQCQLSDASSSSLDMKILLSKISKFCFEGSPLFSRDSERLAYAWPFYSFLSKGGYTSARWQLTYTSQ